MSKLEMMIAVAVLALTGPWLSAQPRPVGPSFPLVSGVSGLGTLFDIAVGDDHFVLVWTNEQITWVQRFALDGTKMGSQITVDNNFIHHRPHVALRANGDFSVQWRNAFQQLRFRSYLADGTPVGDSFLLALASYSGTDNTDLALTLDGRLMSAFASPSNTLENIKLDADGSNQDVDSLLSESTAIKSRLGGDTETGFVQLSERQIDGFSPTDHSAHRLDRNGQPVGERFPIPTNGGVVDSLCVPDLAVAPDGSFVVVWQKTNSSLESEVVAFTMGGDNQPIGDNRLVNDHPAGGGDPCPSIARGREGSYLTVWASDTPAPGGNDNDGASISARQLDADGIPVGPSFQVNDIPEGTQRWPYVWATPDGTKFLVAWYQGCCINYSLRARFYTESSFADGFETGDTTAWDLVQP